MPKSKLTSFRNALITGLLMLAPLAVTVWALRTIIGILGGSITPLFVPYLPTALTRLPNFAWDLFNTIIVLLLIALLGYLSRLFLGRYFGGVAERFIESIPGIGRFYTGVKQIVGTLTTQKRDLFSKVVLVQFPRQGLYSIGFLTGKPQGEAQARSGKKDMWSVFVPTTPNPTSGFLILLPKEEIIEMDMTIGEGMRFIISAGAVSPPWPSKASVPEEIRPANPASPGTT